MDVQHNKCSQIKYKIWGPVNALHLNIITEIMFWFFILFFVYQLYVIHQSGFKTGDKNDGNYSDDTRNRCEFSSYLLRIYRLNSIPKRLFIPYIDPHSHSCFKAYVFAVYLVVLMPFAKAHIRRTYNAYDTHRWHIKDNKK